MGDGGVRRGRHRRLATLIGEALGVEPVLRTVSVESFPFANGFGVVETAE